MIKSERVINMLMKEDYLPIQMLLFYYLGFINQIELANTRKKILLSIMFKTEGFENIRKYLSDIKNLKTQENLEIIKDIFEEFALKHLDDFFKIR